MANNLIIYYSRKGDNYANGRIENLKKGNTEICAKVQVLEMVWRYMVQMLSKQRRQSLIGLRKV